MFMFKKKNKTAPSQSSPHFVQLSEIQKATNNFDESLIIGRGCYGDVDVDVYLGEFYNARRAAVKRLNQQSMVGAQDSWPEVEKQGLCTLRHPNLVSLIAYCKDHVKQRCSKHGVSSYEKEIILVYEYISNVTLKDHLHAFRTPLSCLQRLEICVGVARGIRHLHDAGVMHGDVRSSNIFLTDTWVPKVGDFGLSKLGYLDGYSLDVYSFGVFLLELLCRKPPVDERFDGDSTQRNLLEWVRHTNLEDAIDSGLRNEISPKCLKDLFYIAERCTDRFTRDRPAIAEVVAWLETVLTLQERFSNLVPFAPSVKEFVFNDLIKSTRGFSRDLLLSEAGLWKVFIGWFEHNTLAPSKQGAGIAVAIKSITSEIPPVHNEWLEEVNFLGQLAHPNIVRLLGHCSRDGHEHLLVYEHLEKSLSDFIHVDDCLEPLSWKTRLNILIGVARGLKYLCTVKGVHCNFLIDDILLDEDFNAKFGGFEYVEIQQRHGRERLKGVFGYLKAEYDPIDSYLPMDDVGSFGLLLLETITAKNPDDMLEELVSLEMRALKSNSYRRTIKKLMDPRLKDKYSVKGAFKCMELALRCIECKPSMEEILWSLEQIYVVNT